MQTNDASTSLRTQSPGKEQSTKWGAGQAWPFATGENKGFGGPEQRKRNKRRRAFLGDLKILSQRRGQNDLPTWGRSRGINKMSGWSLKKEALMPP